ncbi:MAG TPA: hypothetical protein ENK11_03650 [Phycisphaerales bacterium]|nr:hypothetical protein [Phycisphaerales bacterium]
MRAFFVAISCLVLVVPAFAEPVTTEDLPLGVPSGSVRAVRSAGGATTDTDARRGGGVIAPRDAVRTLLSLGFVVSLAVVVAWAMKKLARGRGGLLGALGPGGPSPSGVLEIVGRYPVGRGQTLVLLRLDRRLLLLHQATGRRGASMRTLCEITDPDEIASVLLKTRREEEEAVEHGFREAMRRLEHDFSALENVAEDEQGASSFRSAQVNDEGDRVELLGGARVGSTAVDRADSTPDIVTLRSRLRGYIREARG